MYDSFNLPHRNKQNLDEKNVKRNSYVEGGGTFKRQAIDQTNMLPFRIFVSEGLGFSSPYYNLYDAGILYFCFIFNARFTS